MLTRKTPLKNKTQLRARKPMARGTSQLARNAKPMAPVGQRAKRTRQGKVAATVEEAAWMSAAQAVGCIVCGLQFDRRVSAEIHHLKQGDRRRGHLWTIPLCHGHHQGGAGDGLFISRHPWKKRFEAAYGTEESLLIHTRAKVLDAGHALPVLPELNISSNNVFLPLEP